MCIHNEQVVIRIMFGIIDFLKSLFQSLKLTQNESRCESCYGAETSEGQ